MQNADPQQAFSREADLWGTPTYAIGRGSARADEGQQIVRRNQEIVAVEIPSSAILSLVIGMVCRATAFQHFIVFPIVIQIPAPMALTFRSNRTLMHSRQLYLRLHSSSPSNHYLISSQDFAIFLQFQGVAEVVRHRVAWPTPERSSQDPPV